ncbi:hypothetical protein FO519_001374 [Halicephalobus sp. NKZ332]|nr:hypothetical protein FO519_001374 [Halicephalobus sp. NKZ332]
MKNFLLVSLASVCFLLIHGCEDGFDNVIHIYDELEEKDAAIHFKNVKIHGYDQAGKPLCKPSIKFPGFLKITEGEIEVKQALHPEDDLKIEFDLKHNSFLIGTVCEKGKSKNSFVPDEVCNFEVCKAAPAFCTIFATPMTLTSTHLPEGLSGMIPLSPFGLTAIEGEWKASAKITKSGKTVAAIRIGPKDGWTAVQLGNDKDAEVFDKTKQELEENKASTKEEL